MDRVEKAMSTRGMDQNNNGISVVICCYNSAKRLPETLKHLALQNVPEEIKWEVILVDNGSSDQTAETAGKLWKEYRGPVSLRIVEEFTPGTAAARDRGIKESCFEYILFVDDDNWLDSEYLKNSWYILEENDQIGALAGKGVPVFEAPPPEWFSRYAHYFAVGPQAPENGKIAEPVKCAYSAGMLIRKSAWMRILEAGFKSIVRGRVESKISSGKQAVFSAGEDNEICMLIKLLGYEIWYNEKLTFSHYMPSQRLNWTYFMRLNEEVHRSNMYLTPYYEMVEKGYVQFDRYRLTWIKRLMPRLSRLLRYYRDYVLLMARRKDVAEKQRQIRKTSGEIKAWLTIRSRYRELQRNVIDLRTNLTESLK